MQCSPAPPAGITSQMLFDFSAPLFFFVPRRLTYNSGGVLDVRGPREKIPHQVLLLFRVRGAADGELPHGRRGSSVLPDPLGP